MKALWLVTSDVMQLASSRDPEGALLRYPVASIRMRAGVAALAWRRGGNENVFVDPETPDADQMVDWPAVKICILPKFYPDTPPLPWYGACAAAKTHGCALVIDISDYPGNKPPVVQAFYAEALKICDAAVVNSERMAQLMAPHVSQRPLVIQDAILGEIEEPEFAPADRLRLLWFGHHMNLRYLRPCFETLAPFAMRRSCTLTLVTTRGFGAEEMVQDLQARYAPALQAEFVEWSLASLNDALRSSDLVLIPSDPSMATKAGVSANRIAEVLRAGRFPIASPMHSYLPFSDSSWLGEDLTQGILWALANPDEVRARIRRGQALVAEQLMTDRIGQQWRALFEDLANSHAS